MKKSIVIPLLVVVIASVIYNLNKLTLVHEEEAQQHEEVQTLTPEPQVIAQPQQVESEESQTTQTVTANKRAQEQDSILDEFDTIKKEHRLSLLTMVDLMDRYGSRETDRNALINELKDKNLRPQNRRDENPYTGSLNIVRTQNILPGTRYFHAQFFSNDDGSEFLQHLSFEFAPGEQSLEAVVRAVAYGKDDLELTQDRENFRSWRTDDGYIIWAKVLEASDLEGVDPFNAYKPSDIGIIRVAKELDIHDHAPAFHAEQGSPDQTEE
jgi:hypothetical protein